MLGFGYFQSSCVGQGSPRRHPVSVKPFLPLSIACFEICHRCSPSSRRAVSQLFGSNGYKFSKINYFNFCMARPGSSQLPTKTSSKPRCICSIVNMPRMMFSGVLPFAAASFVEPQAYVDFHSCSFQLRDVAVICHVQRNSTPQ